MIKKYENYKKSGVEWLGEIPEHWKASKLKWLSNIYAGGTPSTMIDKYWENGNIPWLNSGTVNQKRITIASNYITEEALNNSSTKWVPKGSLLMALAGQGKTKGIVAILDIDATCNQSMAAIVPNNIRINNEFLYFWLDSNYDRIRGLAGTELRDGLNLQIVGDIFCPMPPISEQTQIANFLDYQITIIDDLIGQKEKLIDLLQEKRQAIINESVTRGLNPDAKMKDSGIEWLGEVPEHWNFVKLRYLNNKIGSGVTPKGGAEVYVEEGVIFVRSQNVHFDGLRLDDVVKIEPETHEKMSGSKVHYNDVLLNITGASIGRCCVVDINEEMNVNQHVCIIRPNERIKSDYLNLVLQSTIGQTQIRLGITGGNREGLNFEAIKDFIILLPDVDTQLNILNNTNELIAQIRELESKSILLINNLKDYRQSLISEAVTGKIDVRDWKPGNN